MPRLLRLGHFRADQTVVLPATGRHAHARQHHVPRGQPPAAGRASRAAASPTGWSRSSTRTAFTADDKTFIESAIYFFLATADADGRPDCSFKGGPPASSGSPAPNELAFPDYDGNGMFKSLGNLLVNPNVGLLFIDLHEKPRRLRVNGEARVSREDPLLAETVGAQLIVRVTARAIFPNCPRYIPKLALAEPSQFAPQRRSGPVEPAWKGFADFKDYVHPRQPTFRGRTERIVFLRRQGPWQAVANRQAYPRGNAP